jgi:hypothetical protein
MILQEKEWTVESGIVTVEFYAEYSKGLMEDLSIRLSVDDMPVNWSFGHAHNEITLMYMGKMTKDYFRLTRLINSDLVSLVEKSITKNLNIHTK